MSNNRLPFCSRYAFIISTLTSELSDTDKVSIIIECHVFAVRLLARMKYLENTISFPCSYKNTIYNSVLDLPIACHGQDYLRRCSSDEISNAARRLFRDVLHFDENRMAGLSELMFRDSGKIR